MAFKHSNLKSASAQRLLGSGPMNSQCFCLALESPRHPGHEPPRLVIPSSELVRCRLGQIKSFDTFPLFCFQKRGWDKSPNLSIVSLVEQRLRSGCSGLYYAERSQLLQPLLNCALRKWGRGNHSLTSRFPVPLLSAHKLDPDTFHEDIGLRYDLVVRL